MVYNGYYKVMSNIPKMGQLPTPVFTIQRFFRSPMEKEMPILDIEVKLWLSLVMIGIWFITINVGKTML
jgi:hypothetical protein